MITNPHHKQLVQLLRQNVSGYALHHVLRDFCELVAITISNPVDHHQYAVREARYMAIVKRYRPEEVHRFKKAFHVLIESLEIGFNDSLGQLFMDMDLGSHWRGQFFTPYDLARLKARLLLDDVGEVLQHEPFIRICEPTCGSGVMVIAAAETLSNMGHNYQHRMHVTAKDVDLTAVHMAYIQLSLYYIPAVVILGDTLRGDVREVWYTPAHILGRWQSKLDHRDTEIASNQLMMAGKADSPATPQSLTVNQNSKAQPPLGSSQMSLF